MSIEKHFQFNRWWTGKDPMVETPIGGSNMQERKQNKSIDGKFQKVVSVVEQKKIIQEKQDEINKIKLEPKTELNKIVLNFN